MSLTMEHGKPLAEAEGEVASASLGFSLAAQEARRLKGETIPVDDPNKRHMTIRRPIGVWAIQTTWNFPINIPVEYLGPAIATGNAVVWKPAPTTSRIGVLLAECILEAGVPPGLVNVLTGPSVEMAEALVTHPQAIGVGFTGSSVVGNLIAKSAVGKHLILELGGNGPVIVLNDADMERTAEAVSSAAFWNAGQSCAAAERILCEPGAYDGLVEGLTAQARKVSVGKPWEESTTMGPVHNEATAQKMDQHVADAASNGARIAFGGERVPGMPTDLYYQPTVLEGVSADALLQEEETFGPIAPVTRVEGDEQILEVAERSRLGLSSAIFTTDIARALRLAERIETGQVAINDTSNYWELHLPFGGWPGRNSGMGRVGGRYALEAMTSIRSISIDIR
jgi:succinate-semialdehyde dehydrogenase/glutarate-semialdehyde dehydrogenase